MRKNYLFFMGFLGILLFFAFSMRAEAQIVNVQSLLLKENDRGFSFGFSGKGTWNAGNTSYLLFEGSALSRYLAQKHALLFSASGAYGTSQEKVFTTKVFEHLRYRYQFNKWVGTEIFLQHEYNPFNRLSLRALGGIGPRFHVVLGEIFHLYLGTAYMFEINQFSENDEDTHYKDAGMMVSWHRWSSYITLHLLLNSFLELIHTTYVQPNLLDFSNYRMLFDTMLAIKANRWLKLTISHHYALQSSSAAAEGVKTEDSSFLVGIAISLKIKGKNEKKK